MLTQSIPERTDHFLVRVAESRARRARQIRRNCILLTVVVIILLAGLGVMLFGMKASAAEEPVVPKQKCFTSVMIGCGESLYDIAERYMDDAYYDDLEDYVDEVCSINHLDRLNWASSKALNAGNYIIVPYYSET